MFPGVLAFASAFAIITTVTRVAAPPFEQTLRCWRRLDGWLVCN
ncbi:hypothetical protein VD0004_g2266 [Verticillium dahliae]|nr:hypothetical protein VD0004_g2266 [Verticillium dahliae]PNH75144.1 hypothetical protein VD0001_g2384 [Verticillium dahliae]